MNDSNDMRELIPVSYDNPERPTVSGRELHDFLEVNTPYKQWFDRMTEYGFSENEDFVLVTQKCATKNRKSTPFQHKSTGEWDTKNTTVWTEAGQRFIYEQLKAIGLLPKLDSKEAEA